MQKEKMTELIKKSSPFLFVGNHRCLDFVNTLKAKSGAPLELLGSFEDLMAWLSLSHCLSDLSIAEAIGRWGERSEGASLLKTALALRLACRGIADAMAKGLDLPKSSLSVVNALLFKMPGYAKLRAGESGFERTFVLDPEKRLSLLYPLLEATCDLICKGDAALVKQCENGTCVLFFYDTTKNHRRRWCSMSACGNRAKVAAFYRRQKSKKD